MVLFSETSNAVVLNHRHAPAFRLVKCWIMIQPFCCNT